MTLGENDEELTEKGVHAMTHDDDARVADLLARLGEGDSRELFRRLLQHGMQELIDAELTAARDRRADRQPPSPLFTDGLVHRGYIAATN